MPADSRRTIETLLASARPEEVRKGLDRVKEEISRLGSDEARELFEVVSTLFHIDPLERPDLAPVLDEAITLVVGFGQWVIPALVEKLDAGDLKAQLAVANALGRIGADAIAPLMAEYESPSDPACRVFILYALGKIKSPRIVEASPLVLEAASSPHGEMRDTATRALGKLAESIPPQDLSEETRCRFIDSLQENLADQNPGIRAKAVRSWGKLARYGHLSAEEKNKLRAILNRLLGQDDSFDWDRAYVVRREAQEALEQLGDA